MRGAKAVHYGNEVCRGFYSPEPPRSADKTAMRQTDMSRGRCSSTDWRTETLKTVVLASLLVLAACGESPGGRQGSLTPYIADWMERWE